MFKPLLIKLRLFVSCFFVAALSFSVGCKEAESLPAEVQEQLTKSPKELAANAVSNSNEQTTEGQGQTAATSDSSPQPSSAASDVASNSAKEAGEKKPDSQTAKSAPAISDITETPWIDNKLLPWNYAEVHYVGANRIGFATLRVETTQVTKQVRIIREDIIDHAADGKAIPPRRVVMELFERENGELMSFRFESTVDGEVDVLIEGRRTSDQFTFTKKVADKPNESGRVPWNLKFWGPLGVQQILMRQPMKVGEKRTSSIFVPQLMQFVPVRLEAKQTELTPLADGKTAPLLQIGLAVGALDSASYSTLYVDEQGVIQKTISRNDEQILLKLKIDQAIAQRLADQTQFSRWSGKTLKLSGDAAAVESSSNVTYLVEAELDEMDPFNALLAYKRQRLKSRSPTACEVQVSNNSTAKPTEADGDREPTEADRNPSSIVPADKPPVVELVAEMLAESASAGQDSATRVELLRAGLHKRIKIQTEFTDIASTLVAARERTGSYIEVAHLMAAVLRNQKVPCRVVTGLRFNSKSKAFVFHVWNQAWIDDKWIDLDATTPGVIPSSYIAMTADSASGDNPYAIYLDALAKINKLNSISVLSSEN